MHFDLIVSNDSVPSYDVHRKTTFFRAASGNPLSLAQFSMICNWNLGKYCSNVALLYANWINKLTLSVSPKKILENMPFYTELTLPPPLSLTDRIFKYDNNYYSVSWILKRKQKVLFHFIFIIKIFYLLKIKVT